jgi:hypothetical protein
MKYTFSFTRARVPAGLVLILLLGMAPGAVSPLHAFPPAPFHLIYGMLRDEFGTPISTGAEVIFETSGGVQIKTVVNPGIEAGANYRLEVPMDTGLMAAPYVPTALRPTVPFSMKVRVGGTTYLPIEMRGNYGLLGQPGKRTRLDLTLGEDSDGDGLPDAWERLINADISKVKPGDNAGKNRLSFLEEYLAGTYVFDPQNGFSLTIAGFNNGAPLLEFLAITGRTYTVQGSSDLAIWTTVSFRVPAQGANAALRDSLQADSVKKVQVEVPAPASGPRPNFFRLMLQ